MNSLPNQNDDPSVGIPSVDSKQTHGISSSFIRRELASRCKTGFLVDNLQEGSEPKYLSGLDCARRIQERGLLSQCVQLQSVKSHNVEKHSSLPAESVGRLLDAIWSGHVNNGFTIFREINPGAPRSYDHVTAGIHHALRNQGLQRALVINLWGNDFQIGSGDADSILCFDLQQGSHIPVCLPEGSGKKSKDPKSNIEGGCRVQLHLDHTSLSESDYMAILFHLILPVAFEFNPDIVILLADFGNLSLSHQKAPLTHGPAVFRHITRLLLSLAGGRCAAFIQDLPNLSEAFSEFNSDCVVHIIEALLGYPCLPLSNVHAACNETVAAIQHVIKSLRHWKCFSSRSRSVKASSRGRSKTPLQGSASATSSSKQSDEKRISQSSHRDESAVSDIASKRNDVTQLQSKFSSLLAPSEELSAVNRTDLRTCVVYDVLMLGHNAEIVGDAGPEIPGRIEAIYDRLSETGLLKECLIVNSRDAEDNEVSVIHSPDYVTTLHLPPVQFAVEVEQRKLRPTKRRGQWPDDIWATKGSQPAIWRAAGSLLNVVDTVLRGKALNGYAIIRPPGHHAHHESPSGFCFVNNVAVAAKFALKNHNLSRILIVDWDVHHGDGTQEAFYKDERVCYISLHRGEVSFYPEGKQKTVKFTGAGKGAGYNINIPWQTAGMEDGDYISAFLRLVMPVAYEFSPDFVLVSCGFDAALADQLGGCRVTHIGYGIMTRMLMNLAGGRLVLALEGGYNLKMLAQCSESVVRALLGYPIELMPGSLSASANAAQDITDAIHAQQHVHQTPWHFLLQFEDQLNVWCHNRRPTSLHEEASHKLPIHQTAAVSPADLISGLAKLNLN